MTLAGTRERMPPRSAGLDLGCGGGAVEEGQVKEGGQGEEGWERWSEVVNPQSPGAAHGCRAGGGCSGRCWKGR